MSLKSYFGTAIRQYREKQGLSQESLAEKAELDRTYVSGIERGRRNPSLLSIERLAKALGIGLDELFSTVEQVRREKEL